MFLLHSISKGINKLYIAKQFFSDPTNKMHYTRALLRMHAQPDKIVPQQKQIS